MRKFPEIYCLLSIVAQWPEKPSLLNRNQTAVKQLEGLAREDVHDDEMLQLSNPDLVTAIRTDVHVSSRHSSPALSSTSEIEPQERITACGI
jgi:hypothetical protein